jgi:predicted dithiol-disulfide oxidoreductase (DUF899 family)
MVWMDQFEMVLLPSKDLMGEHRCCTFVRDKVRGRSNRLDVEDFDVGFDSRRPLVALRRHERLRPWSCHHGFLVV